MTDRFPKINLEEPLLPEIIADYIIDYIRDNQMKANDRLPGELELAQSFGVSRGTIRSAIALLKSRNIVVRRRGSGTYIAEKPGMVDDPFGLTFIGNKMESIRSLTETRGVIEPGVAALAAENARPEDIKRLEELRDQVEECIRNEVEHIHVDEEFHIQIARCTHNPMLVRLVQETLKETMPLLGIGGEFDVKEPLPQAISAHRKITEAIRTGNPEAARLAMIDHQLAAMHLVEKYSGYVPQERV